MLVDPFEMVKQIRPGIMILGNAKERLEDDFSSIFLIREEDKYIKKLGYNPVIQVRMAMFTHNNIPAIFIMVKINNDNNMLYDAWLNYHDSYKENGSNFEGLLRQENLIFQFYNDKELKRTVAIPNKLKEDLNDMVDQIKNIPKWSMKEFDSVKEWIYHKYPNGQILWNSIS